MSEEEDSLAWHALNYRTAHTNNAEEMWQELQKFVARKRYEERDRCCRAIFGLCISDNNAQEIVNKIRSGT